MAVTGRADGREEEKEEAGTAPEQSGVFVQSSQRVVEAESVLA